MMLTYMHTANYLGLTIRDVHVNPWDLWPNMLDQPLLLQLILAVI